MSATQVDLFSGHFWWVAAVGVLAVYGIRKTQWRKWAWAIVNVAFLATLLEPAYFAGTLATIVAIYLPIRLSRGTRNPWLAPIVVATVVSIAFVTYKVPQDWLGWPWWRIHVSPPLAALGFSYIFLRLIEMVRMVSEGDAAPPDFPSFCNYLLPFHMLAAGPIQSYSDFVEQPATATTLSTSDVLSAAERIALGLFKKYVLAVAIHEVFLTGFRVSGWYFWAEVQLNFLWLYLDFSAYSDIAVGIGRLMGVSTPENFNRPYLARNMINFWERWHISLSQWIRRNIFIPLQMSMMRRTGGRYALLCASVAFLISFGLCGLWHNASLGFLLWGLVHGVGLMVTNLYRFYLTKRLGPKGIQGYMQDRRIAVLATVLTWEYVALSLVPVMGLSERFVQ